MRREISKSAVLCLTLIACISSGWAADSKDWTEERNGIKLLHAYDLDGAVKSFRRALRGFEEKNDSEGIMRCAAWLVLHCYNLPSPKDREGYCTQGNRATEECLQVTHSDQRSEELIQRQCSFLLRRSFARFELGKNDDAVADALLVAKIARDSDSEGLFDQKVGIAYETANDFEQSASWFARSKAERMRLLEKDVGGPLQLVASTDPSQIEIYIRSDSAPSDEFLATIKSSLERVPLAIRRRFNFAGIFVAVFNRSDALKSHNLAKTPRGYEAGTTFLNVPAYFSSECGAVVINEQFADSSGYLKSDAHAGEAVLHEIGHGIDHYLSESSSTVPFWNAYVQDSKVAPAEAKKALDYYFQQNYAGPIETFAQAFAVPLLEQESLPRYDRIFEASFPNVLRVVKEKVTAGFPDVPGKTGEAGF